MIQLEDRIEALAKLGKWLKNYEIWKLKGTIESNSDSYQELNSIVHNQHIYNHWQIEAFIDKAIHYWSDRLSNQSLRQFVNQYTIPENINSMDVAVIPEPNIPLSGLHDAVCIWLTGHRFLIRNINHELDLLSYITKQLLTIAPFFKDLISWVDRFPKSVERFLLYSTQEEKKVLKQYFSSKHSLIRTKRISVAILPSDFTHEDVDALAGDMMDFFGQSNRNVRKIYVPCSFTAEQFFPSIENYAWLSQINRYINNFDYHRSVFLMERLTFFENGFFILKESSDFQIPTSCLYFEYYHSTENLFLKLQNNKQRIQQIVCKNGLFPGSISSGSSQAYPLEHFDDMQDVMHFLLQG
jgi:hypothetical protein